MTSSQYDILIQYDIYLNLSQYDIYMASSQYKTYMASSQYDVTCMTFVSDLYRVEVAGSQIKLPCLVGPPIAARIGDNAAEIGPNTTGIGAKISKVNPCYTQS